MIDVNNLKQIQIKRGDIALDINIIIGMLLDIIMSMTMDQMLVILNVNGIYHQNIGH